MNPLFLRSVHQARENVNTSKLERQRRLTTEAQRKAEKHKSDLNRQDAKSAKINTESLKIKVVIGKRVGYKVMIAY